MIDDARDSMWARELLPSDQPDAPAVAVDLNAALDGDCDVSGAAGWGREDELD